jgi:hypothetical protein
VTFGDLPECRRWNATAFGSVGGADSLSALHGCLRRLETDSSLVTSTSTGQRSQNGSQADLDGGVAGGDGDGDADGVFTRRMWRLYCRLEIKDARCEGWFGKRRYTDSRRTPRRCARSDWKLQSHPRSEEFMADVWVGGRNFEVQRDCWISRERWFIQPKRVSFL